MSRNTALVFLDSTPTLESFRSQIALMPRERLVLIKREYEEFHRHGTDVNFEFAAGDSLKQRVNSIDFELRQRKKQHHNGRSQGEVVARVDRPWKLYAALDTDENGNLRPFWVLTQVPRAQLLMELIRVHGDQTPVLVGEPTSLTQEEADECPSDWKV